tara:strand:+ start:267 stop:1028 length:762 start_codon:yes stop_codon:yes gene_type:complete
MNTKNFRARMLKRELLVGIFLKTPALENIEVLALSGLDFICLDCEHAPIDRRDMDTCVAMGRALDIPTLIRVPQGSRVEILKALDVGATGIVVPHVNTVEKAQKISRYARFGHGGRGFAGSTRWANYTTNTMTELIARSHKETVVIAQIEEPEALDAIDDIASTEGIDGLFIGPADLAVCLNESGTDCESVNKAMKTVAAAAKSNKKCAITFIPDPKLAAELQTIGLTMFCVGSEQSLILAGARQVMATIAET